MAEPKAKVGGVTVKQRPLNAVAFVVLLPVARPNFKFPQGRIQWWHLFICVPPSPSGSTPGTLSKGLLQLPTFRSALALAVLVAGLVAALLPLSFLW
jgi:hypothetical protein